jgi:hypothetical protein
MREQECAMYRNKKTVYINIWWNWGLNSGLHACKTGALLLEPHLQPILLWLFWRCGLRNYLHRLVSNLNPLDLNLPSS